MGVISASLDIGDGIGPPLAAAIVEILSWRVSFVVLAMFPAPLIPTLSSMIPESSVRAGARFDYLGALGLAAAVSSLMLAITQGPAWGLTNLPFLVLMIGSIVMFLGWSACELRRNGQLVDLRTTAKPETLLVNLTSVLTGFSMFAIFALSPSMLQASPDTG